MNETQKTVLIVDDERPIHYALSRLLEQWGYLCVVVSSGQEALERVGSREFDLMLLDVRMPGMSGLEVLKKFRVNNHETSVVMLSAVVDKKLTAEAMKLGADDYIIKPCSPDDLRGRLKRADDRRELTKKSGAAPAQLRLDFAEVTKELISEMRLRQTSRLDRDPHFPNG